jgi:hypothetical protein
MAATHKFLHLVSATRNADGSLTVTGNSATLVCGGPDDFHYDWPTATVTGRVLSSATLRVLNSSLAETPMALPKFPAYLATDRNVRVFAFTGSLAGITGLAEQFHP